MKTFIKILLCAAVVIVQMKDANPAVIRGVKLRRDLQNLYPFPRVGRAAPSYYGAGDPHFYIGQQTTLAYPRIGRRSELGDQPLRVPFTHVVAVPLEPKQIPALPQIVHNILANLEKQAMLPSMLIHKRNSESESTDSTGMWFGPRLGRSLGDPEESPKADITKEIPIKSDNLNEQQIKELNDEAMY